MKYLTKILVDKKLAASKRLNDAYAWHKALWRAFPGINENERIFLNRIDSKDIFFQVLLLSRQPPIVQEWGAWQTKKISESFLYHDLYRFELRANPTIKRVVRDKDGTRKKTEGALPFIKKKSSKNG